MLCKCSCFVRCARKSTLNNRGQLFIECLSFIFRTRSAYLKFMTMWSSCLWNLLCIIIFFHSYQLCGCGILSFGIYVQIEKGDYAAVTTTRGLTAALLLIVAGLITAVISFMGCLGAYKKMRTLLWIVSEESYYVDQ